MDESYNPMNETNKFTKSRRRDEAALLIISSFVLMLASSVFPKAEISYSRIDPTSGSIRVSAPVQIGTGNATVRKASEIVAGRESDLKLTGVFKEQYGTASAVMEFLNAENLSEIEEITFWIYANGPVAQRTNRYIVLDVEQPSNFGWGFYLFDDEGNYKGIPNVKINWTGWNQVAIPLRSSARDVSPGWNDSRSLKHLKRIRFDLSLLAEPSLATQEGSVLLADIQRVSADVPPFSFLAPIFIILGLICLQFYLVSLLPTNRLLIRMTGLAIILHSLVAICTPMSSDFISSFYHATPVLPSSTPLDSPLYEGGPFYFSLLRGMYHAWSVMPVDHPRPLSIFPGYWSYPALFGREWWQRNEFFHFLATPGSLLLTYMLKLPNVAFTIGSGIAIYLIASHMTRESRALSAAAVWLFNPVTLLISDMWAPVDPAPVFFTLIAVLFALLNKSPYSGMSLGLAVATRLAPLLQLPVFLMSLVNSNRTGGLKRLVNFITAGAVVTILALLPTLIGRRDIEHIPGIDEPSFLLGTRLKLFETEIALGVVVLTIYYLLLFNMVRDSDYRALKPPLLIYAILGLWVSLFAFSKFPFHLLLWIIPYLILAIAIGNRNLTLAFLFVTAALASAALMTGPYFSTFGHSILFVPNISPWMRTLSQALFRIGVYPSGIGGGTILVLSRSVLSGVALTYAATILIEIHRQSKSSR